MITKFFVTAAVLLGVLFLTSMYLVFRSSEVPIPIEDAGRQVAPVLTAAPLVTTGTAELYTEVMRQAAVAVKTYEETRGQSYRVDLAQADGGLRAVLSHVSFVIPADQSFFWRLVHGEKGLVLCGQYLRKSEAESLTVVLREAAKLAPAVEQSGPCGQDAFGVQLTGAAPVAKAPTEGLPLLPPVPGVPPPLPERAAAAGLPPATSAACATSNPALEERLLRLL